MAYKSITPKITKENNQVIVADFAQNIGIQSIEWVEKPNYDAVVITYVDKWGGTTKQYLFDKGSPKKQISFKTEENKKKALQYVVNVFANLCMSVKPDLELIDTTDLKEAYEEYARQIDSLLPSECKGSLKMCLKETKGQYYNFIVSRNLPVYSHPNKVVPLTLDTENMVFEIVVPENVKPDVEEGSQNEEDMPF